MAFMSLFKRVPHPKPSAATRHIRLNEPSWQAAMPPPHFYVPTSDSQSPNPHLTKLALKAASFIPPGSALYLGYF